MVMWSIIVGVIFTIAVLLLTLLTIQKGYGYKHTIDPAPTDEEKEVNKE